MPVSQSSRPPFYNPFYPSSLYSTPHLESFVRFFFSLDFRFFTLCSFRFVFFLADWHAKVDNKIIALLLLLLLPIYGLYLTMTTKICNLHLQFEPKHKPLAASVSLCLSQPLVDCRAVSVL